MKRKLTSCAVHGKTPWKYTIRCKTCGRIYQAALEGIDFKPVCEGAVRSPEVCPCGTNLPEDGVQPICTVCFIDRVKVGATGSIQ